MEITMDSVEYNERKKYSEEEIAMFRSTTGIGYAHAFIGDHPDRKGIFIAYIRQQVAAAIEGRPSCVQFICESSQDYGRIVPFTAIAVIGATELSVTLRVPAMLVPREATEVPEPYINELRSRISQQMLDYLMDFDKGDV